MDSPGPLFGLSPADAVLVQAATAVIVTHYRSPWHVAGAALRLVTGEIVTGVNLDATVGRVAVCAEATALGRAKTEHGSSAIDTIVAVYHPEAGAPVVCSPCGMCRELIADYAPGTVVIIPEADGTLNRWRIGDLLPAKYARSPQET